MIKGVPCRKVKVGRFGWFVAGEHLIFSIYQVGMDGRVFLARNVLKNEEGEGNEVVRCPALCVAPSLPAR